MRELLKAKIRGIGTFATPFKTFFVIRKRRGTKILSEVLAEKFEGIIIIDGWMSYSILPLPAATDMTVAGPNISCR